MIGRLFKAYMPTSLYGRAALILLVPILTIMAVASTVFIQRLYADVTAQMTRGVADEISAILRRIDDANNPADALITIDSLARELGIGVRFSETPLEERREWIDLSGLSVRSTLRSALPQVIAIDLLEDDAGDIHIEHASRFGPVTLSVDRGRFSPRNPHQILVLIGLTAFFMTSIGLLYLRGQVRPIRRLAAAASAFGKGRIVPYRPLGATEVREAGRAFLEMRDRIERQIEQRTLMLSGVSHDLRTPLTRMRLALSLAEETEETKELLRDVKDMEEMLDAFLSFARSEAFDEPEIRTIESILTETQLRAERAGQTVKVVQSDEPRSLKVRPVALARALDNLIGNALRYGTRARLSAVSGDRHISFIVEDDGPGIAPEDRERAVTAFARLDEARNQDSGSGVGLGLAITADIARQHGGSLILGSSQELGGLRAELILPK